MVRAGEASGTLGPILKRLAEYLEQRCTFRQSMISSMIYPLILMGVSAVSMVIPFLITSSYMYITCTLADTYNNVRLKNSYIF